MKRKLGFVSAFVFALGLGLSTAFAQSTKPAAQSVGRQGATKPASTSMQSGMRSKIMAKKTNSRHYRHHRKIARRVKNGEKQSQDKKDKEGKNERS